jgi:hypothetical protein
MELELSNAIRKDNVFYWDIPFVNYQIESITVITDQSPFYAKYNELTEGVEQILESGRTDGCPAIFTGQFSVFFYTFSPTVPLSNIQSIQIKMINIL